MRALANATLFLHFERIYAVIWASQVFCLRYLNPQTAGAERSDLQPIYDSAAQQNPEMFKPYSFTNGFNI